MTLLNAINMNKDNHEDKEDIKKRLVTPQRWVNAIHAEASAWLSTEKTAAVFYELVKNRMQHVNSWPVIAGQSSSAFQLVNKEGLEVFRKAQEGDYVRIDVMTPDGATGDGYDWIRIESLTDDRESEHFEFRVRPAGYPSLHRHIPDKFQDHESISSFRLLRKGRRVMVIISDRDIVTDHGSIPGKIRDHISSWSVRTRFAAIHWQALADGLVSR